MYNLATHPVSFQHLQKFFCTEVKKIFFLVYRSLTYLINVQDVQQKAREEAIRVLGDHPVDVCPTLEQIKEMPYIQMIIKGKNR